MLSSNNEYLVNYLSDNNHNDGIMPIKAPGGLGITSVVFPNTLRIIGNYAFRGNSITKIKFPSSLLAIGDEAFYNNPITGELDLTNTKVETIGYNAFIGSKITSVKLPNTIVSIGNSAFYNWNYEDECNYLTNIYLGNANAELGSCVFGEVDSIEHNLPDSYLCES